MSEPRTHVMLVDDHALLAETLLVALSAADFAAETLPIPDDAGDADVLLGQLLARRPEIVMLDLDLGSAGDGVRLVEPLTRAGSAVVVVTSSTDPNRWGECLAAGARTVLPKSSKLEHLVETVTSVAEGRPVISVDRRACLIQQWQRWRAANSGVRARLDRLTPREGQVLAAMVAGRRVRVIAAEAYVSEATVRTQVKSILAKLGVTSQIAAVALARDMGWSPGS